MYINARLHKNEYVKRLTHCVCVVLNQNGIKSHVKRVFVIYIMFLLYFFNLLLSTNNS